MKRSSSSESATLLRTAWRSELRWCCALLIACVLWSAASEFGPDGRACQAQEVVFSPPDEAHSIAVTAASGKTWSEGGFQVVHLTGPLQLRQGTLEANAREAVLFIDTVRAPDVAERKVIVYLEGGVQMVLPRSDVPGGPGTVPEASPQRLGSALPLCPAAVPCPTCPCLVLALPPRVQTRARGGDSVGV